MIHLLGQASIDYPDSIDPRLVVLLYELEALAEEAGHDDIVVTSLRTGRTSRVHAQGRAADVRTRDLPADLVVAMHDHLRARYRTAQGEPRTGEMVPVLYEVPREQEIRAGLEGIAWRNTNATGEHLHIQVPTWDTPWWMPILGPGARAP